MLAAAVDVVEVAALLVSEALLRLSLEDLREAQDGVQGGPEFVRHVDEKVALRLVPRLGLPQGGRQLEVYVRQLGGALLHAGLQGLGVLGYLLVQPGVLDGDGGLRGE